ncbi:MAG: phosphoribosyltransferase family protein [Methylococcaceae bacterium]|nr:phosphoribosyltransferase family protein [Methylococcaceae bacterium]
MHDPHRSVSALRRIKSLPIDLEDNIFSHYPAMKLGVHKNICFYAEKLAESAFELIDARPERRHWVLTAPPYYTIPAAANLLCWRVHELLKARLPRSIRLSLVNLRLAPQSLNINNAADFQIYFQYSKNSIEDRIKEREKLHLGSCDIIKQKKQFETRAIIVINDIKVTGTQQKFMQASFDRLKVDGLHWLYIIEVNETLGRSEPHIEHIINQSNINSLDEFKKILQHDDISYTARCVSRLFSYEIDEFNSLLFSLSLERRIKIYDLACREGRYEGDYFREKVALLKVHCRDLAR